MSGKPASYIVHDGVLYKLNIANGLGGTRSQEDARIPICYVTAGDLRVGMIYDRAAPSDKQLLIAAGSADGSRTYSIIELPVTDAIEWSNFFQAIPGFQIDPMARQIVETREERQEPSSAPSVPPKTQELPQSAPQLAAGSYDKFYHYIKALVTRRKGDALPVPKDEPMPEDKRRVELRDRPEEIDKVARVELEICAGPANDPANPNAILVELLGLTRQFGENDFARFMKIFETEVKQRYGEETILSTKYGKLGSEGWCGIPKALNKNNAESPNEMPAVERIVHDILQGKITHGLERPKWKSTGWTYRLPGKKPEEKSE